MAKIIAVIGANYGDEGKGYMTDYFANQAIENGENAIVVMTNGGAQRGHTVETPDGKRFVFHHFGSGTLVGAPTYAAESFILNPMVFATEFEKQLQEFGIKPTFYMSPFCRFTTPFDMMANMIYEDERSSSRHGSVGMGIWETVRRYQETDLNLTWDSFHELSSAGKVAYMQRIKIYHETRIEKKTGKKINEIYKWRDAWTSDGLIEHFLDDVEFLHQSAVRTTHASVLSDYDTVIMENAQGLLLDQDRYDGTNHTTPSHTGAKTVAEFLSATSLGYKQYISQLELCYVSRSYLTKHGAGDFPGECAPEDICEGLIDRTNVHNEYQGSLRYGYLDVESLVRRIVDDTKAVRHLGVPTSVSVAISHLNECNPKGLAKIVNGEFGCVYMSDGRDRLAVGIETNSLTQ
jgi:adenylosuccinate synthase